ncbi:aspartate kinase [Ponticoccus sp. SC2-23]|uniref:aspartate kinase n=1 Tax=Alexandriicola marinus TaxID=2081710 RepID=UPI000FD74240|nr:aspartate kinase [Alexandriicola marinus]MBM1220774.1 aspartate kinase [Ponticoccus sp. SC6-9]MBM1225344.1 aspartate kinase [Ponticoccus sp. SC6-15]MBM1227527.1 aspartate kinase [Ponticoccus sp. SC6-38]MBM1234835.1 aspartate kinase [Ponticoccus sp. SC6-45]MBM1238029.1 aspartate kinase [Ponticoccus sp. SC6-49]MBM1244338.1 aspartate kinase [Ponticoccus sp. SC2-64]MBM1248359.1 aspartate kinase [Ponticoccus sp. SC6-42]MBM1252429.1 aspartate kinase [Ponticoccus sp. SC6-33]MBM1256038.1 aspart
MTRTGHTVEKIGGTSMSRLRELRDTLLIGEREGDALYNRIFVVSAFGGITDLLLEHKKSGQPGVYGLFANDDNDHGWLDALSKVATAMSDIHATVLESDGDRQMADEFVRDRIEGARSCLFDLQRLCSYGHFRLADHMGVTRELLSGLGEAHSAFVATLLLQRSGVNARFVDLSGWRDDTVCNLRERIGHWLDSIDLSAELPIVTGYAQCSEGLMKEYDRGYSEVTFANISAHTGAEEAIIHKEFHLSSADPKLVGPDAVRKLGHTNYDVADQLSNMGMEAIHPNAAKILRRSAIPLRVTNAFDPGDPGTLIDDQPAETPGVEIVTGLDVVALEVFEQDMVGVKGYDATILDVLKRHNVWIVSKSSNANTITHYVHASLKTVKRVVNDLETAFPSAEVGARSIAIVSAIGRDLCGVKPLSRGLRALEEAGIDVIAAHQTSRNVDVQFAVPRDASDSAVARLHEALIGKEETNLKVVAA